MRNEWMEIFSQEGYRFCKVKPEETGVFYKYYEEGFHLVMFIDGTNGYLPTMGQLQVMQERVQELNKQKALIKAELLRLSCVKEVFEDKGNFVLVRFKDGAAVFAAMKAAGIILRDFSSKPGLDNSIRITIGYQGEMDAVLAVLRDLPPPSL